MELKKITVCNPKLQSDIKTLRIEVYGQISFVNGSYNLTYFEPSHEDCAPLMTTDGNYHVFYTLQTNRLVLFEEVG